MDWGKNETFMLLSVRADLVLPNHSRPEGVVSFFFFFFFCQAYAIIGPRTCSKKRGRPG